MSRFRKGTQFSASGEQPTLTLEAAIQEFLGHHRRKGSGARYLEELTSYLIGSGRRCRWLPLLPWCMENASAMIHNLNREALARYLETTRLASTPNVYFKVTGIVRMFLCYMVAEKHLAEMPLSIERPKRLKAEVAVFTRAEVFRLRDVVKGENERDWAIFTLLLDTGIRCGELCSLRLDDVRFDRREVVVRASVSKNKNARVVPISASIPALRRYLKLRTNSTRQSESFFLSFYSTPVFAGGARHEARRSVKSLVLSTTPLTRVGLYQLVRKWGRLAGLTESRCSPHTFRHYFATHFLRRGGDIVSLQRMLGHSRLDVTERYLKLSGADVSASHERYSPAVELFSGGKQRLSASE